ncbi:MAG: beta-lactamase family protein [Anaerolineae bacterium]|nr:beta-lactamase family protein [Gemmatimonadaceae bacterium]
MLLFSLVLVAFYFPLSLLAQRPVVDTADIGRYVTKEMRADRVPGLGIVVVTRDSVLYAQGFGSTGRKGESVTADTPFLLGSMSKSVTALAIMQLVEAGRVHLDSPVVRYLPDFVVEGTGAAKITVRHLLAHTSGIPASAPRAHGSGRSLASHIVALHDVELASEPGATHEYSSPNYQVLGRLVEVVSGEPFAAYVQRNVFGPLGMRRSFADSLGARASGLARGHQMIFGMPLARDLPFEGDRLPAAALVSTAGDMGRFLQAQLREGELNGARVASIAAFREMHKPQVQSEGFAYAMGWRVNPFAGGTAVHHGGILPNYRGKMVLLPELGVAVVVLTNVSSVIGAPTSHRVADGVAGLMAGRAPAEPRWSLVWFLSAVALGMVAITALQIRGLLRARRGPRQVRGAMKELVFAGLLLLGPPLLLNFEWVEILRQTPDVGSWMLISAALGAVTAAYNARGIRQSS